MNKFKPRPLMLVIVIEPLTALSRAVKVLLWPIGPLRALKGLKCRNKALDVLKDYEGPKSLGKALGP
jgi:hypothetical protein